MAKNPVEQFQSFRTKESADRAQEDLRLWSDWHQGGRTPEGLEPLMKRYEPVLARAQNTYKAPAINPAAFKAELQKHFIQAAETFDPSKNVAFNTHVQNRLKKSLRYTSQHQNFGYIPEDKSRHIGDIGRATDELTAELGRPPTHEEIGSHIGIPGRQVQEIQKLMRRDIGDMVGDKQTSDLVELEGSREQDVIRLMSRRPEDYLTPDEVPIFKHVYGVGVQKVTSTGALGKKLGLSDSRISRLKSSIGAKIKKNLGQG